MAKLVKHLPYKYEDLGLIPATNIKSQAHAIHLLFQWRRQTGEYPGLAD